MKSIGVDAAYDPVYPDLVFSLQTPRIDPEKRGIGKPLTVGVGVMNYAGWSHDSPDGEKIREEYIAKITQFVLWLLDAGYRVRLLIGNQSDCATVDEVIARASAKLPRCSDESLIAEPAHSLEELMRQISSTDIVVATRFHNIVCALKVAKPVISLGYAKKNEILLREMGLGEFHQETEKIDVALLIRQFEKLIREREQLGARIRDTTRFYEKRLLRQEARLLEEFIQ
jgi:polysaccharide pyruvyl transferase WcaK-like protein